MAHPPRLVYLLGSAQRRLQQWIAAQQERAALSGTRPPTPAQAGVLFVLARSDGVAMGQLAEALDLAPSAASGPTCPMQNPRVAPENRPSVISATFSPMPCPYRAAVVASISRMPGPPLGPS